MTTLVLAVLDLDHERLRVVSAGHLPPVAARGPTAATTRAGAARATRRWACRRITQVPRARVRAARSGSTLVLVTDGAVEVRGESVEHGLERLRALVAERDRPRAPSARRSRAATSAAGRRTTTSRCSRRASSRWRTGCAPAGRRTPRRSARCGRCCAAGWRAGAPGEDEIYDITVAVQEASANAVEHAYAPGTAMFEVEADARRRRDHGRDPRPRALARAARDASRPRAGDDAGADGVGRRQPRRRAAPWSCCGGRWGGGRHEPARPRGRGVARRHAGRRGRRRGRRLERRGRRRRAAQPGHEPLRTSSSSTCRRRATSTAPAST